MKATIRFLVCVAAPTWAVAPAQQIPAPTVSGHVLVLDNERILEGEITRDGELFHIRREGSELTLPAGKALAVCANLEEAYQFLCSRANLRDADEHMRLARWCLLHELRDQAIAEAKTVVEMRPSNAEARQLLTMVQHANTNIAQPALPPPPEPAIEPELVLGVSGECLALFTTKVQPILMNTCASCHATGRGGSFIMVRASEAAGRKSTQQNLTAVIKQICFDQPSASPLLFMAAYAHGKAATAPLANRGEPGPFVLLQGWVDLVVAQHPHLRGHGTKAVPSLLPGAAMDTMALKPGQGAGAAVRSLPAPEANAPGLAPAAPRQVDKNPSVVAVNEETQAAATDLRGSPPQPPRLPRVEAAPIEGQDEYSADRFNQLWHPGPP